MDNNALYNITYGIYVVGCYSDGKPAGCIINTCFQVTSENPTLAICLNKNNHTLECLKKNPRFCISIISEDTDPFIISSFGFRSARDADKYADLGYDELDGTPAVKGNFCGRLILDAMDFIDCGTHVIVISKLVNSYGGNGTPMTYAYYHSVIKGSAPKMLPPIGQNQNRKRLSRMRRENSNVTYVDMKSNRRTTCQQTLFVQSAASTAHISQKYRHTFNY